MESTRIFCMIRVMDETFEFFASMNILCYNGILEMRVIFVNITVLSERVRTSTPAFSSGNRLFFVLIQVMPQRSLFCYNEAICYNRMIGKATVAPTSCTNAMLRGLHLVTQTIQLTDDLVDQILIPVASLEEITVNEHHSNLPSERPTDS